MAAAPRAAAARPTAYDAAAMGGLKRALPDVLAGALLAAALLILVGHVYPNFDYLYALVWGREILDGNAPEYLSPYAPAAHPLLNAVAAGASLLDTPAAVDVMRLSGPLSYGALCVGVFRLGQALHSWPVGLVAAVLTATREPVIVAAARSYIDVPTTALIVWAAVLEARRPRRGAPVAVLLMLAGLLRPETWAMAGVYLLWVAPKRDWRGRVSLAAITAAGPVVWLLSDFAASGDPLFRFRGLRVTVPETLLGYPAPTTRTGLEAVPDAMARNFGNFMQPVPLALAVGGFLLGLVWLRRRMPLPTAIAALNSGAFIALAITGIVLEQRYLFPTAAMLTLFAGLFVAGWLPLAAGPLRRGWAVAGLVGVAALLAFVPADAGRLDDARAMLADRERSDRDLRALIERPEAARLIRGAHVVHLQSPVPLPFVAVWTGRPFTAISVGPPSSAPPSVYVAPRDPALGGPQVPPGYRLVAGNGSWLLSEQLP